MTKWHSKINPVAAFHCVTVSVIYLMLYWGHYVTPDLIVGRFPSIIFGVFLDLPLEEQYPLVGALFFFVPGLLAFGTTRAIPWRLRYDSSDRKKSTGITMRIAAEVVLVPPFLIFIGHWLFLPLEFTPAFLYLLLSAVVFIASFFRLYYELGVDMGAIKEMGEMQAIEYLKLKNKDAHTFLNLSIGSGFSLIITLLIGSVTFFYGEVLRFGVDDPRGRFPLYQTGTIVILAALILIEIIYELAYKFYSQMTLCTEALGAVRWDKAEIVEQPEGDLDKS